VDDLRRVSGIGAKTLDRLRPYVTVGEEPVRLTAAD
jgi:type II secretory pathway component PulK